MREFFWGELGDQEVVVVEPSLSFLRWWLYKSINMLKFVECTPKKVSINI